MKVHNTYRLVLLLVIMNVFFKAERSRKAINQLVNELRELLVYMNVCPNNRCVMKTELEKLLKGIFNNKMKA